MSRYRASARGSVLTGYASQGRASAGVVLYYIAWQGYPPHMVWYEPGGNLDSELLEKFEQCPTADAAADETSARENAKLIDLKESERMPA
eukprot:6211852-Pleurochrysis_carterae.AAC.1